MREPPVAAGRLRVPLYAFSFASGAAALVYQVVWTRLLSLTFGRTTVAASAVVAGFLGGMGLGAWLYHRARRTRPRAALRLYALLELGIALAAAVLTPVFFALPALFGEVAARVPAGPALDGLRVVASIALLLVPAALMGATYPALCTVLIGSRAGADAHLGRLYGWNTLGAAAGALGAGLLAVEILGLRGAAWVAGLANLAIAAAARALAARIPSSAGGVEALAPRETALPTPLPPALVAVVLFGSGLATLAYEILWFRALQYLFGNSTYALALLLVVFLLGLGFGGLALERVLRRGTPERDLAFCQLGIAALAVLAIAGEAAVLASDALEQRVSIFFAAVYERVWWQRLLTQSLLALGLMLPATLLMGVSFPLATRLLLGDLRQLGARVGAATLLANLGSLVGSVGAALLLLPALGTVGGTRAVAALNLLLAWLVLLAPGAAPGRLALAGALSLAVLAGAALLPARLPFRGGGAVQALRGELVFEEEGDLATVQVWQNPTRPRQRAMTLDGTAIGVSPGWNYAIFSKQRLLAHLPLALDARIRHTLNVGLGSASTLDALAGHRQLTHLDVVEISDDVVRASRLFAAGAALDDPRVRVEVEDALHFLLRGRQRYDLIVSDGKQNADFSGNAALLCREFYASVRTRLRPEGLLVQWLPLATRASDLRLVLRTFAAAFPEVELFLDAPHSLFLVGSGRPLAGRPRPPAAAWQGLPAGRDLERLRIPGPEALLARWVAGGDAVRRAVGAGPVLTWNRPVLEFSAYRAGPAVWSQGLRENLDFLIETGRRARAQAAPRFVAADAPFERSTGLLRQALQHALAGDPAAARRLAEAARRANPADPRAALMLREMQPPGAGAPARSRPDRRARPAR